MENPEQITTNGFRRAYDFDGTLVADVGSTVGPEGWSAGPAWEEASEWVRRAGVLTVITGRVDRWEEVIQGYLAAGMRVPLYRVRVYTSGAEWAGWKAARDHKARVMKELGVTRYYGDQDHLDGGAAWIAGAEYYHIGGVGQLG